MTDSREERPGTAGERLPDPWERGAADGKSYSWRTLAISVLVAVALSVTVTLLLGGGLRSFGGWGCGGWAATRCPGPGR